MTIDEVIKYEEELADTYENACKRACRGSRAENYRQNYRQFGERHRQLAEWLKELKVYRECKLTDKEQRIFLSGMGREYEVCKEADDDFKHKHPYEDTLAWVCNQIEKKVKKALF